MAGRTFGLPLKSCLLQIILLGAAYFPAGAQVSLPRPEHPQPQLERKEWINLNGAWEFEIDQGNSGEERRLHLDAPYGRTIRVPFCPESELSGVGYKDFMLAVWYRRAFDLPAAWKGRRIILHFGAVDYEAKVWVNGQLAGTHRGGYSPFSLEVTGLVKPEGNTLVLRAYDDTRSSLQPKGKQSSSYESHGVHYTRTTGIWQTVWLEAVGRTYLKSFRVYPGADRGAVNLHLRLDGPADGLEVRARVLAEGKPAGEITAPAQGFLTLDLPLALRRLWNPGQPFLYDLEITILDNNGRAVDQVHGYFGLRKVEIRGRRVLINDRPVFQRLVLDQGFYPEGIYTAPSDEALKQDIEMSLALGFNGARLHQKVFEPRFLYWADRLGYLVWGEFPNWGLDHSRPEALERMLPEWTEVVERDFNHPSIITWTPFNETPRSQNPAFIRTVYRTTKALDPTRPVHDTSGYVHVETDIFSVHCYVGDTTRFRQNFEPFRSSEEIWQNFPENDVPYAGQPFIVDEYGGIWWNPGQKDGKAWGYGERPLAEQDFLARYRALTETLLLHPKMFGFCYTQLYDIEQEVNGLYTYDRRPKFDPAKIRAINSRPAAYEGGR